MSSTSTPVSPGEQSQNGENGIIKVVFASLVGTAVEWYDFFLYGSAAALVFGALFFPDADPVNDTWSMPGCDTSAAPASWP